LRQVGHRVKAARLAHGGTQEEVADRARIDYKRYQALEAGRVNPTIGTLLRVAEALDLSIWLLLGGPSPKPRS
jgi:transcriptional regulator with XRE-family HTH domain